MRYLALLLVGAALVYGQCNMCTPDSIKSPRPYGFNPSLLWVRPNKDTTLTIYFTFPDSIGTQTNLGYMQVFPNYAIWVDSLRLDNGLITKQDGTPFAYNASNPPAGPIHFDQMHRYKQWGPNPNEYANFVVYQNPGTSQGEAGATPPIGCAHICIKSSSTEGSDTLRVKVRAFVPVLSDPDNKDTTNFWPNLFGNPAWLDTTFRYAVVVSVNPPSSLERVVITPYGFRPLANPAYREAVVTYTLPTAMPVRLRAYGLDGREVLNRELGLQPSGTHQESLQLPAGHYFLRLETPYNISSTRLTVIE